jgi:RND family efflux transporter MFP subunit
MNHIDLSRPRAVVLAILALAVLGGGLAGVTALQASDQPTSATAGPVRAALTVQTVQAQPAQVALSVPAQGAIAAWQEASVGAESGGWRLAELKADLGDRVRKGQVLARFDDALVQAEMAQTRAALVEAEATAAEAAANAARARELSTTGALSAQQIEQFVTAERTAAARVQAQRAALSVQALRLSHAEVRAPDDGIVVAREATIGAVVPAGTELFRLIRKGRLEWRAEVAATDLEALRPGQKVRVMPAGAPAVTGTLRQIDPQVDAGTRNARVYVDLPAGTPVRPGMFARGEFEVGQRAALTLPDTAVLQRDGFSWVFTVEADQRVRARKVTPGRRAGDRLEILGGLDAQARVVASGAGFLADGDTVRVVQGAPVTAPGPAPAGTPAAPSR